MLVIAIFNSYFDKLPEGISVSFICGICLSIPLWFDGKIPILCKKNSNCLAGGWYRPTPLKNDGVNVSWEHDIPNWMGKLKFMFQTTNQISMFGCLKSSHWTLKHPPIPGESRLRLLGRHAGHPPRGVHLEAKGQGAGTTSETQRNGSEW